MNPAKSYGHGWYSQSEQWGSDQGKLLRYSTSTKLSSYLPNTASRPTISSTRGDTDVHPGPVVLRQHHWPEIRSRAEPVEFVSAEYSALQRGPPVSGILPSPVSDRDGVPQPNYMRDPNFDARSSQNVYSNAGTLPSNLVPGQYPFVETRYSPRAEGTAFLPNREWNNQPYIQPRIPDVHFDRGMQYPISEAPLQSHVGMMHVSDQGHISAQIPPSMSTPSFHSSRNAPPITSWNSSPEVYHAPSSFHELALRPAPSIPRRPLASQSAEAYNADKPPPIPDRPWAPPNSENNFPITPPPIPPRPAEFYPMEMPAEDVSPRIPPRPSFVASDGLHLSSVSPPVNSHSRNFSHENTKSPPASPPNPQLFWNQSPKHPHPDASSPQFHEDTLVSPIPTAESDVPLSSPFSDIPSVTEQSPGMSSCSESMTQRGYSEKKPADYDSFYTPANQNFYSARLYTRLNRNLGEIRLLRIFPKKPAWQHIEAHPEWNASQANNLDRDHCLMACEIEKTRLSSIGGNYCTLSYCAGDPQKTAIILVNGVPFNAFASLEHAIERLWKHWSSTHPDGELLLWADQISINQSDKDERSEQVQLMRDIYQRSAETYVCLSTPKIEDCLSWVPRMPRRAGKGDSLGVIEMKNVLLDLLVGKGKGGDLRPNLSRSTSLSDHQAYEDKYSQTPGSPSSALIALQPRLTTRSSGYLQRSPSSSTVARAQGRIVDSYRESSTSVDLQKNTEVSANEFQNSFAAFMMNKWWRRSWVYQEFLSGPSVHFMSGDISVPWIELSPLVEFICEGLDKFMEDIREFFDSEITEDMRSKDREEKERERRNRRDEQKRLWQRQQRKAKEERKRKKKEMEEKRRQQEEQERENRKIQAEREAQRLYQQQVERYHQESREFEAERLSQWKDAMEEQFNRRSEYQNHQQLQLQRELTRLERQKAYINKMKHPVKVVMLHRQEKRLLQFQSEISKPINDQIRYAQALVSGNLELKNEGKRNEECDGRLHLDDRIQALLDLDRVEKEPERFVPKRLKPPSKPASLISASSLSLTRNSSSGSGGSDHRYGESAPVRPKRHRSRRAWERPSTGDTRERQYQDAFGSPHQDFQQIPTLDSTVSAPCEEIDDSSDPDLSPLEEDIDIDDKEWPTEHQEMSFDRLEAHEIEQRDKITRLQDEFRQLDKNAIASMAKGKADFRRHADLIALLQHSRNCDASDPRDRVYAFLGLADPKYGMIPNYRSENKLEEVLVETAKSIIQHDRSLVILQHVHRGRAKLGVRLPSWVPDWTSRETNCGLDEYTWDNSLPFDAAKGTFAAVEFHSHDRDGFYENLGAKGIFVGKIEEIEFEGQFSHVSSFTLSDGEWAFGPKAARLDDEVWVLFGATRPVVLRREPSGMFSYLGDALLCIDGLNKKENQFSPIMFGQMVQKMQDGVAEAKDIWIA